MTTAETRIHVKEVPLAELEVPPCEKCGSGMELQPVGLCVNPQKGMVPAWTVLKPICHACGHVFMEWLGGRMLFPCNDEVAWEFFSDKEG